MESKPFQARCCIAGGGPAGMMLGFLLARAGVDIVVLEKHGDFLRDFRGDTVHPSTLDVIAELGLLNDFLARPHTEVAQLVGRIGETDVKIADFSLLRTRCHFIALMPQWDFLNFLVEHGRRYPGFRVMMQAEVTDLIREGAAVTGVRVNTPDGPLAVRADLIVGADGRHSTVRERAGLIIDDLGAPMDVLWMRLSKHPDETNPVLGRIAFGRIFIMLDRGDYWQCGFVIPKGGYDALRARGLQALRDEIVHIAPLVRDRVDELRDWDDVKLLTVRVDRLRRWYQPGLLCIGDAAHAMSPVGGIGINLAIQDAVASANILAAPLRAGKVTIDDLARVERRRMFPTRLTQMLQVSLQERVVRRVLANTGGTFTRPPLVVRAVQRFPYLSRIPARVIGIGFRPEHVHTPEITATRP